MLSDICLCVVNILMFYESPVVALKAGPSFKHAHHKKMTWKEDVVRGKSLANQQR